ncbi:MAG TPA: SdrD B-like domain-containing protein, partial [Hymenobacter sp.]
MVKNGTFSTYRISSASPSSNPTQAPASYVVAGAGNCPTNVISLPAGSELGHFSSSFLYVGANQHPDDNQVSVQCGVGNYVGGLAFQQPFPGDPRYNVAAAETWLYSNGNTTGAPATPWQQTVTGLSPNTRYTFSLYTSNVIEPMRTFGLIPSLELQVSDQAGVTFTTYASFQVWEDHDTRSGHGSVDLWDRRQVTFTTAPGQTSAVLRVQDIAVGEYGGDLAMTAIGLEAITSIRGTVFEDPNYGGGAGRSVSTTGTTPLGGATVELYNAASGALVETTTTNNAPGSVGQYLFDALPFGDYVVRVVSSTVSSARPGYAAGLLPVQTYNGTVDHVGGEDPQKEDAPINTGAQLLPALTTATTVAQNIASVTAGAGGATTVNFGFSFDVIVNTNDAGQGSLRQFILNSNALTNAGLAQAGQPAGQEVSIFMVPDGRAHPGLRAGLANQLSAQGVALVNIVTDMPVVTDAHTTISGLTQTVNIGNTNPVVLGTGGTVGVNAVPLSQVNGPEVELIGNSATTVGLYIGSSATNAAIHGLALYGFGLGGGYDYNLTTGNIRVAANNVLVSQNVLGSPATTFTDPGASTRTRYENFAVTDGSTGSILSNNLVGFANGRGILVASSGTSLTIMNNELRSNALAYGFFDGLDIQGGNTTVTGNLCIDNSGGGFDTFFSTGGNVFRENTVTRNGRDDLNQTPAETSGIRLFGVGNTVVHNIISDNYGAGILVTSGANTNLISQNSILNNGAGLARDGDPPTGQLGIDLLSTADEVDNGRNAGTPPFITLNDVGDGDAGGNGLLNAPVLESAAISGDNLLISGFAAPGTLLEFFLAAPNELTAGSIAGNNFGQGHNFMTARNEGSAQDLDNTTGSYGQEGALVNGFYQGTETDQSRFRFALALSSLTPVQRAALAAGGKLTATATLGGNTSELSGNVVASVLLEGIVFEDVNYGGGAGRTQAASSGVLRPGVRMELYSGAGAFVGTTTTNAAGAYSFSVPEGSYTVRVVSGTVTSSRPGYVAGLLPVQTYNGAGDRVGGEVPGKADAPANTGSQSLASLNTASTAAQSVAALTVGAGGAGGVDFGFNFSTIVNANLDGQGSLRQFVLNSNALGGEASLAQSGMRRSVTGGTLPLPAGKETSIFMVPNGGTATSGTVRPGFRSYDGTPQGGPASGLDANGVANIVSPAGFATISGPNVAVDGTTQTANIGNTNNVVLGTGGTVGVQDSVLVQLNGPEVQLRGARMGRGLEFSGLATNSVVRGLAIFGFVMNVYASSALNNQQLLVEGNVLGTAATSFTDPGASARTVSSNVTLEQSVNDVVRQNLIGFAGASGVAVVIGGSGHVVRNNEIRGNGLESIRNGDGIEVNERPTGITIVANLLTNNACEGIDTFNNDNLSWGGNNTVRNNTISNNGLAGLEGQGIHYWGNNNTTTLNRITGNRFNGVLVGTGATGNVFSQNSFSANGGLGLDLVPAGNYLGDGATLNDPNDADTGTNNSLNFPVLATAIVGGGNLTVQGFARPGTLVELYVAAADPTGFGEGQTYLFAATEGSAQDRDNTTGAYGPTAINGVAQGQDNTNRFTFGVPLSSLTPAQQAALSVAGARLTATATAGGNTSEYGGNVAAGVLLSGVVFEDVNYGGGAGRGLTASAGVPRPGATVELYDNAGALLNSTTTDAAGAYSFSVPEGSYTVRVVNSTVRSSRLGGGVAGLLPVQTYNGAADRVGGEAPEKADAPANAGTQTLASLATAATAAQSVAAVTVSAAGASNVDFGFNFDLIVNTNDAGQGSLRQFILNSNVLGGEASLAQAGRNADGPLPTGRETSIFMIPSGQAVPGLRASTAGGPISQLTAGVAIIRPINTVAGLLPTIRGDFTALDASTQSFNVGHTNGGADVKYAGGSTAAVGTGPDGIMGTGDEFSLTGVDAPEVQLQGPGLLGNFNTGVTVEADDVTLRGLATVGFRVHDVLTTQISGTTTDRLLIENNVFGTPASGLSDPGGNARSNR